MLHLLNQKRSLANEIIDGTGSLQSMSLPSSRDALMEKIGDLTGETMQQHVAGAMQPSATEPGDALRQDILARWRDRFDLLELHGEPTRQTLLAVSTDQPDQQLAADLQQQIQDNFPGHTPQLELIDRKTFATIQRLIEAGVLNMGSPPVQTLHSADTQTRNHDEQRRKQLIEVRKRFADTERQQRMVGVLADGGFSLEALAPLSEAVEAILRAVALLYHEGGDNPVSATIIESTLLPDAWLTEESIKLIIRLRQSGDALAEDAADELIRQGRDFFEHVSETLNSKTL